MTRVDYVSILTSSTCSEFVGFRIDGYPRIFMEVRVESSKCQWEKWENIWKKHRSFMIFPGAGGAAGVGIDMVVAVEPRISGLPERPAGLQEAE